MHIDQNTNRLTLNDLLERIDPIDLSMDDLIERNSSPEWAARFNDDDDYSFETNRCSDIYPDTDEGNAALAWESLR